MRTFKNLQTRTKLIASFAAMGLLFVAVCWVSLNGVNQLTQRIEFIYKANVIPMKLLGDLQGRSERMSALVAWHILAADPGTMAKWAKEIAEIDVEVDRFFEAYAPIIASEPERKFYEQFKAAWASYKDVRAKVLSLSAALSKDAAAKLQRTELAEILGALLTATHGLMHECELQAKEAFEYSENLASTLHTSNFALILSGLVLGSLLCWVISRLIGSSLNNILKAAEALGSGNLAARSSLTTKDDIGRLAEAFNKMGDQIEDNMKQSLEAKYKMSALDRALVVIEFNLDGTIISANQNYLNCLGYTLGEIKGHHQRMFADPVYAASAEYQAFWAKLNRGEFDAGVYRRVGKGSTEIWIQASYNPILDVNGKPYKVVMFATDITGQKQAQNEVEKLIRAAAVGELSNRINTEKFEGTAKDLTTSFNQLLDAITTPLYDAQGVLASLAACDLTKMMTGSYQGEFDQMKSSLNSAVQKLTDTIMVVREAVEAVTTGAEQINKGSQDLSQRTSEQASSLEETSASMEEMTSSVKQNADNAKQANQLAIAAREVAERGGAVTVQAVEAMGEINKSSKKIADIITVIDEIAFQTNLLALNAAVEAARAGEHGRGFAVVAAEVRNLAQRSATAAKEIKGLINESIQRVTDGSDLVNQSGKTLDEIVNSVKRVTDIIAEIAAASQEQASGINQVNKAIMQMDETTQQNAALVEETTCAAQVMQQQSNNLLSQVAAFKVHSSEEVKAKTHAVAFQRHLTARAIHDAYEGSGADSAPTRSQVSHTGERSLSRSAKTAVAPSSVRVAAGNGKDRRRKNEEFEEF